MAFKKVVIDGVDKFPLEPSLNETNLSDCYDTLEIVYDEVSAQDYFSGQMEQLNYLNNAMLIVNEWFKGISGEEKEWLPTQPLEYVRHLRVADKESVNDSE